VPLARSALFLAALTLIVGCSQPVGRVEKQRLDDACPVTLPNGRFFLTPFRPEPQGNHGNDDETLFTDLRPDGTVVFRRGGPGEMRRGGSLAMKWPWMRNGVVGRVEVTGRRLDDDGPPPDVEFADGGGEYGFQPSALVFPSAGCWEITARVGASTLTFVTRVVRLDV
jgi:hypothetical protein